MVMENDLFLLDQARERKKSRTMEQEAGNEPPIDCFRRFPVDATVEN